MFWGGGAPHFFDGRKTVLNCGCNVFFKCWSIALFSVWIFLVGEDVELDDGEGVLGVRFLLLEVCAGTSKAMRSCCLMGFGILAVFNESLNADSEFNLILPRILSKVSLSNLLKTSFTRENSGHVVAEFEGVFRAWRSCCLIVFGMLALFNESLNVDSDFKLILSSTFHRTSVSNVFKTSFTRGNSDHVVAVLDRCDMVYIISHRKKFHAPFFYHIVL